MTCLYILAFLPIVFLLVKRFLLLKGPRLAITDSNERIHVLITGGSKGIGLALAEHAASQGAHVTLVARNKTSLLQVRDKLAKLAPKNDQQIRIIPLDLCEKYEVIDKTLRENLENGPPIDILINNAGRSVEGRFDQLKADDFETQIKMNYLSAVYVTKSLLDGMKLRAEECKAGGRIVFLSSQAGQVGLFSYTAYSSSKFALAGFAQALQMELAQHNIWITVVYPPNTNTEGFANELLTMSEETRILSGTAGLLEAETVAKQIWHDANIGKFCCHFGSDGWMLANLCAGMSPEYSFIDLIQQTFLNGVLRVVALFHLKHFYSVVVKKARRGD